jgi:ABC-2 type transport system permease protein
LLAGAAISLANGLTASEEDAGRLELVFAQPISRQVLFMTRVLAGAAWVALLLLAVAIVQLLADSVVGLTLSSDLLLSTVILCGLLAMLSVALALAIAGLRPRPSVVLGVSLVAAIGGCAVDALFPLSVVLEAWVHVSPWSWALGGDPLVEATEPWRYLAPTVPTVVLVVVGVVAFSRRDAGSA